MQTRWVYSSRPWVNHTRFITVAVLLLSATGCGANRKAHDSPAPWKTYTSADGNVSFQYPPELILHDRPQPDMITFFLETTDESLGVTVILKVSEAELSGYTSRMWDAILKDEQNVALTDRKEVTLGNTPALRQEFLETAAGKKTELIAIGVESHPYYLHMTAGYSPERRAQLRPICEKILASVVVRGFRQTSEKTKQ
jgi:hypothetical protein